MVGADGAPRPARVATVDHIYTDGTGESILFMQASLPRPSGGELHGGEEECRQTAARVTVQAAGFWLLASGCWLLAAGCWLLAALMLRMRVISTTSDHRTCTHMDLVEHPWITEQIVASSDRWIVHSLAPSPGLLVLMAGKRGCSGCWAVESCIEQGARVTSGLLLAWPSGSGPGRQQAGERESAPRTR